MNHLYYRYTMSSVAIPMDIYESPREIVILMPLWWVDKKSIELYFEDFKLIIKWFRAKPALKEDLILQQEECYWGEFMQDVSIPPYVYFDRIHSVVSSDNILIITVPKSLQPWGKVKLEVELPTRQIKKTTPKPSLPKSVKTKPMPVKPTTKKRVIKK